MTRSIRLLLAALVLASPAFAAEPPSPGSSKPAAEAGVKARRWPIRVWEGSLRHVLRRHTRGGPESTGKSVFFPEEDIRSLIRAAETVEPKPQRALGTYKREVEAGRPVGIDRATRKPTSLYTVITAQDGALVTAFPGRTGRR